MWISRGDVKKGLVPAFAHRSARGRAGPRVTPHRRRRAWTRLESRAARSSLAGSTTQGRRPSRLRRESGLRRSQPAASQAPHAHYTRPQLTLPDAVTLRHAPPLWPDPLVCRLSLRCLSAVHPSPPPPAPARWWPQPPFFTPPPPLRSVRRRCCQQPANPVQRPAARESPCLTPRTRQRAPS